MGVDIAGDAGHEARDVAGTAGAAEPRAAGVLAVRTERVGVEIQLAVEAHAGDQAVIQGALHHVDVFAVAVEQELPVVPVNVADLGAGFAVGGHVRQFVVVAEPLAVAACADSACYVELLGDDVLPDPVDGFGELGVAHQRGDVGHARIHIDRADGVPDGFVLFENGFVVLGVFVPEPQALACGLALGVARVAAGFEEELGELDILFVAGHAIELGEAHFDDLVAGRRDVLVPAEGIANEVGALEGDIQQRALAGGLVMGDGGLVEVAEVVKLVAARKIAPAHRAPSSRAGARRYSCAGCKDSRLLLGRRRSFR